MGAPQSVKPRIVFDTNVVVSALVFRNGRLAVLREHWRTRCTPLVSTATVAELVRVLGYRHLKLGAQEIAEVLALYLPYIEQIEKVRRCRLVCGDSNEQMFLDLAHSAGAELLITGDQDLLALSDRASFRIVTPADYLARQPPSGRPR